MGGPNTQPTSIRGGAKILTFQQNHNTSIALSVPEGGPNSIENFDGGPWPDLPPPGSAIDHWPIMHSFNITATWAYLGGILRVQTLQNE